VSLDSRDSTNGNPAELKELLADAAPIPRSPLQM